MRDPDFSSDPATNEPAGDASSPKPKYALWDQAADLAAAVDDIFVATDWTLDNPERGHIRFRGHFVGNLADEFKTIKARFNELGFTPMARQEDGQPILIAAPFTFAPNRPNYGLAFLMFALTIGSTLFVGAQYAVSDPSQIFNELWRGWPFSLSLLTILGAHELGHFFAARYHGVSVSPPYFIPFPTIFGTMGAFISLKEPLTNRRVLLDVGAAGPLCGLLFAIPILFIGLMTSEVNSIAFGAGGLLEGNSILYAGIKTLVFGRFLPDGQSDVFLNQVAWAGWAGLLVTGLNLFPVGQLDGGHVAYVLFGRRARRLYWPVILGLGSLAAYGMITNQNGGVWLLWLALLTLFGRVHAQPLDDITPLDDRRRFIAILTLVLFFIVFVPFPITIIEPGTAPITRELLLSLR